MKMFTAILTFIATTVFLFPVIAHAGSVQGHAKGRILLQVEKNGEAWYVNPEDKLRYYLGRPLDAWNIMRELGQGIANTDLNRIPTVGTSWTCDARLMPHVTGHIMLQVEKNGEAWYVYPANGKKYYLGRPDDAYEIMRELGLGATTDDIMTLRPNISISWVEATGTESVELSNDGSIDQVMEGWSVRDKNGTKYAFPSDFVLEKGTTVRVFSASGDHAFGEADMWEDDGDIVYLYGPNNTLVDSYQFPLYTPGYALDVPFTSQAPYGSWHPPFNQACEEAVLVMMDHFFRRTTIQPEYARLEILRAVDWQLNNLGFYQDTGVEDTGKIAAGVYGWNYYTYYNVDADDIKRELHKGNPVLLPIYGANLPNPRYSSSGRFYHMVLAVGYDDNYFFIHDPVNVPGEEAMRFKIADVENAMHDLVLPEWNTGSGPPAMLIVTQ